MTIIDQLETESDLVLHEIKRKQHVQRALNIIMLLAISALFCIVVAAGIQDQSQTNRINDNLRKICQVVDPTKTSTTDKQACATVGVYI
jgi:hypothetical protein